MSHQSNLDADFDRIQALERELAAEREQINVLKGALVDVTVDTDEKIAALRADAEMLADALRRCIQETQPDHIPGDVYQQAQLAIALVEGSPLPVKNTSDPSRRDLNEATHFLGLDDAIKIVTPYSTQGEMIQHIIQCASERRNPK